MADLYLELSPELSTLRRSDNPREREVAAFIETALADSDNNNHRNGLYDFKNEALRGIAKFAARAALRTERFSSVSYALRRLSVALLAASVPSPHVSEFA